MYDEIYSQKWDKDPSMYNLLGGQGATITTVKYQDNKNRKHVLLPFFAKNSVSTMQWLIQEKVGHISDCVSPCRRVADFGYRLINFATFSQSIHKR